MDNSILYAGYQYDEETGLYYINARMYDPVTAQFLQADTYLGNLNDPLSLNLYTYCMNNSHKYVDPTGHSVLLAFLLVTAVSFAVGAGMEYINQKYIEKRDVINYDLIFFEGAFNAVIAAVSFGTANLGVAAARQGLRLTARTATQAAGRSMAFGAMEGATESIGRQLVEGKAFSEIDYGQVAFSATINGITGGFGGYSGVKQEAFGYARQATKSNVRSMAQMGVGVGDVYGSGTASRFKYKHNPMDNPKAARDIIVNPDAVYGFSPNPNSTRIGAYAEKIDWTNPEEVAVARKIRQAYHAENDAMLDNLYKQGYSQEQIANKIIEDRNVSRLNSYISNGDWEGLEIVKRSNLATYGNENGMTLQYALEKYGSYDEIIKAATRSNPGMDACTGLFDIYHGGR